MIFNVHSRLEGQHAFLSASKYHWVNYDEDKLAESYSKYLATQRGTRLHEFANECILLGIKLPKTKKTLNMYVNDAIGFKMKTEQPLYYSENAFGTADAISFKFDKLLNKYILRIHDLKTGTTKTSMRQLEIYVAYFCLEYNINPNDIFIELRIYQNDEILVLEPNPEDILYIMDKTIMFDKQIDKLKIGA
jgi:hypothetical protein